MSKYKAGDKVKVKDGASNAFLSPGAGSILTILDNTKVYQTYPAYRISQEVNNGRNEITLFQKWVDNNTEIVTSVLTSATKPAPVYAWQWGQERNPETEFKGSSFYGWDEDWD
jgi:hypothetical protein